MSEQQHARLRELPSVDELAARLRQDDAPNGADGTAPGRGDGAASSPSPAEAVAAARAALSRRREQLLAGASDAPDLLALARQALGPSLRPVLNGTGVAIHTNLGRAPLAEVAIAAVERAARGYDNLELDLESGRRGARDAHVRELLCELTGAEDALVVNNGAGAALLAIAALASEDGVVVSRGQLVEIGGGFRIPDVLAQAGVPLVEVGTTNRTRLADYERAVSDGAGTVLRVHQSNFRTVGFVEEVEIEALCALPVPVIDDLGSGALVPLADEPQVPRSVSAGAALVCFSGDKLLGGPQAGVLVGVADAVAACRRHPLARALRIGRLPLAGLAATLALYRDPDRALREIPVLAMLRADPDELAGRARRLAEACDGEVVDSVAKVGGGALPLLELAGPAVALGDGETDPAALAAALRAGEPPLLPRLSDGRVIVDPRTLLDGELDAAACAIRVALTAASSSRARS